MKRHNPVRSLLVISLAVTVVVAAVCAAALWALRSERADPLLGAAATFTTRQGPLTISVTEKGTIKARQQHVIKSKVEGETTIIYLIPEGTWVKAGDLLVELDTSGLEATLIDQKIAMEHLEAAVIQAREQLAVSRSQEESDIAETKLQLAFANENKRQYLEGEYPKLEDETRMAITLVAEELKRAEQKLKWSQKLLKENYISETEFDADRLSHQRATLEHNMAEAELTLLRDFTRQRHEAELEADIDEAERALDRAKRKGKAAIVQAKADLEAKESELEQQLTKLRKLREQIEQAKISAPAEGMVVYVTSAQANWAGNNEPLQEGHVVRERQELIYLPTPGVMMADLTLHESSLNKVKVGMPVHIEADALPGEAFTGRVAQIAPLPDPISVWMNPDLKVYATQVHIDGIHEAMRTGMSCQTRIIVDHYDQATFVPVQAVVPNGSEHRVYTVQDDRVEPRTVQIGLNNNRMVRIRSGLAAGEQVLLAPPLVDASPAIEAARNTRGQADPPATPTAVLDDASTAGTGVNRQDRT